MSAYVKLLWFFLERMVAWLVVLTVVASLLIALSFVGLLYVGDAYLNVGEAILLSLAIGSVIGLAFGTVLGMVGGVVMFILTLALRFSDRPILYRTTAAMLCSGLPLATALLLALPVYEVYPPGPVPVPVPTPFQYVGIPLIVSAPLCGLASERTAKACLRRNVNNEVGELT